MNKFACQYAIVRFTPFVETEEFANAGIIMISPQHRYFGFKLLDRRYARVTRFFEELDAKFFRATMLDLKGELKRINDLLKTHGFDRRLKDNDTDFAQTLFREVIRTRETIIRFSKPSVVLTGDPKEKLTELFAFYVERNFVNKEYRETIMERCIKTWLIDANVSEKFVREKIGDEMYRATFPFVEFHEKKVVKIIKPLNLRQKTPSQIIEHGGKWQFRVNELKKRKLLPEKVLFAVEGSEYKDDRAEAYEEVVEMLTNTGVKVLPYQQQHDVVDFAVS